MPNLKIAICALVLSFLLFLVGAFSAAAYDPQIYIFVTFFIFVYLGAFTYNHLYCKAYCSDASNQKMGVGLGIFFILVIVSQGCPGTGCGDWFGFVLLMLVAQCISILLMSIYHLLSKGFFKSSNKKK
ncbi:MAG: hypothetical protein NT051_04455 [Candidatus Micrarchaeota archaeon]|nr:hypothetical protein [Candidatus Micrarchaeota archaeon]